MLTRISLKLVHRLGYSNKSLCNGLASEFIQSHQHTVRALDFVGMDTRRPSLPRWWPELGWVLKKMGKHSHTRPHQKYDRSWAKATEETAGVWGAPGYQITTSRSKHRCWQHLAIYTHGRTVEMKTRKVRPHRFHLVKQENSSFSQMMSSSNSCCVLY